MLPNHSELINVAQSEIVRGACFCEPVGEATGEFSTVQKPSILHTSFNISENNGTKTDLEIVEKKPEFSWFCENCGLQHDVLRLDRSRTPKEKNNKRLAKIFDKYWPAVQKWQDPAHVILTYRRFADPGKGKKIMNAAVKQLLRIEPMSLLWKNYIIGWDIIQKPDGKFNVHPHLLVDTPYVPEPVIRRAWAKVMPGARNVHIKRPPTARKGLKYILKDVIKTRDLCGFDEGIRSSLKGIRLVNASRDLLSSPGPAEKYKCPRCGSTSRVYRQEEAGTPALLAVVEEAKTQRRLYDFV